MGIIALETEGHVNLYAEAGDGIIEIKRDTRITLRSGPKIKERKITQARSCEANRRSCVVILEA